jgi:hypothetical protein
MRNGAILAVLGIAAIMLVEGCTSTQPGSPGPVTTADPASSVTSSPTSSGVQAPKVANPLNDSGLRNDPCSALSAVQVKTIGLTAAAKSSMNHSAVGNVCSWTDDTVGVAGADIGVGVETMLTHGLSDIYAQRQREAYFTPMDIDGYPAVLADEVDDRSSGSCGMNVAISDTSVVLVNYQQSGLGAASCDKVQAVAHAVIATLKGA